MYLLSRLRRGPGAAALALLTATTLTAVWALPLEVAAKPKKSTKSETTETTETTETSEAELPPPPPAGMVGAEATDVDADADADDEPKEPTGAELDASARAAFDSGDFASAGQQWALALEATPEDKQSHIARSVMLINAVNAYKQVYAESRDRDALFSGREVIHAYMRSCKYTYDLRCNSYSETDDARERLAELTALIDESEDLELAPAPPEYNTAIGGRPMDVRRHHEPLPPWTVISAVGGAALIGGGAYLLYWARTEPKFQAEADTAIARFAEGDDTDTGTDTTTDSDSSTTVSLSDETKGKIYTGFGISGIAIGVGFIVLGALGMRRVHRINRKENLALRPAIGRDGGGLVLLGRF